MAGRDKERVYHSLLPLIDVMRLSQGTHPPEVGEVQEMEIRIPVNNYYPEPEGLRKYLCKFYGSKISPVE